MKPKTYLDLKQSIIDRGYEDDILWAEDIKKCNNSIDFLNEYIWVICNSGMKAQIAKIIFERIVDAFKEGRDISEVFGHKGKVAAIKKAITNQAEYFRGYSFADDKLEYCKSLPWIGPITKYHLAKNLGEDCIKPDRHLVRIAKKYNTDPFTMCEKLSEIIGDSLNTVDTVIWRAANLGLV